MNPYIGDRPLDPPEDDECEFCKGWAAFNYGSEDVACQHCQTDNDPGEPNDPPDEG